MIDLYTWTTPNGRKISVALEELGLPYTVKPIDIGKGDQHAPAFVAINPNSKIPAIVDHDAAGGALNVFESGAILIYLAEKTGKLLPREPRARASVLEWLMVQLSGIGPNFGQYGHFIRAAEKIPYAIQRFTQERERLSDLLEKRLATVEYLGGEYSIADVATYPWVALLKTAPGALLDSRPHLAAWIERVGARPAVQRGMAIPAV